MIASIDSKNMINNSDDDTPTILYGSNQSTPVEVVKKTKRRTNTNVAKRTPKKDNKIIDTKINNELTNVIIENDIENDIENETNIINNVSLNNTNNKVISNVASNDITDTYNALLSNLDDFLHYIKSNKVDININKMVEQINNKIHSIIIHCLVGDKSLPKKVRNQHKYTFIPELTTLLKLDNNEQYSYNEIHSKIVEHIRSYDTKTSDNKKYNKFVTGKGKDIVYSLTPELLELCDIIGDDTKCVTNVGEIGIKTFFAPKFKIEDS